MFSDNESIRFGETLNCARSEKFSNRNYIQNNAALNLLIFDSRWADCATSSDLRDFFSKLNLHENTHYADFSALTRSSRLTREVCEALPPQITTVEIPGVFSMRGQRSTTYAIPSALQYAKHITRLIVHYPAYIAQLSDFNQFITSLGELTKKLPRLHRVYLAVDRLSSDLEIEVSEEEAKNTRNQMLESLSFMGECRFYQSGVVSDKLINTESVFPKNASLKIDPYIVLSAFRFFYEDKKLPLEILLDILLYADAVIEPKRGMETLNKLSWANYDANKLPRHYETNRLLNEHHLFSRVTKQYLQDNRHESSDMQHEYDKQFGLVSVP